MYYVYILKSLRTGELYKGITNNLDRRLKEHFSGKSYSTKSMLPLKLVHVEICKGRKEARLLEKYYKSGSGRETLKYLAEVAEW
jgi:putative endonuclease